MAVNVNPFNRISWSRACHRLDPILNEYTETAKQRVTQGLEHIYCINDYSICLLRAECFELVVVGFEGKGLLSSCAPLIAKKAKLNGFTTIRIHTKRKGECRFLNKHGLPFRIIEQRSCGEYVMRLEL